MKLPFAIATARIRIMFEAIEELCRTQVPANIIMASFGEETRTNREISNQNHQIRYQWRVVSTKAQFSQTEIQDL